MEVFMIHKQNRLHLRETFLYLKDKSSLKSAVVSPKETNQKKSSEIYGFLLKMSSVAFIKRKENYSTTFVSS